MNETINISWSAHQPLTSEAVEKLLAKEGSSGMATATPCMNRSKHLDWAHGRELHHKT
jgi:hypothetical protein